MSRRVSVNGSRGRHHNPIPNASRVGGLIMSSIISGVDPETLELPDELGLQITNIFRHIRHDVEAAGATVDDIVKVSFWMKDPAGQRAALNEGWLGLFPDPDSRPARETLALPEDTRSKVLANFTAFVA